MQARDTFGTRFEPSPFGQILPLRTGVLLCDLGRSKDVGRQLSEVRVYRGEPSPKHSPKGQAAMQRQVAAWNAQPLVTAVTRPLHYYPRDPDGSGNMIFQAREKGIDVLLALDMALGAERDAYEIAVLFSADTDLIPAVEAVRIADKRCEVAAWRPDAGYGNGLRISGVWRHWLDRSAFDRVSDPMNYTS